MNWCRSGSWMSLACLSDYRMTLTPNATDGKLVTRDLEDLQFV